MRILTKFPLLIVAVFAARAIGFAAPADVPRRSAWLTFVDGARRDIDGEWSAGGHVTVLRSATASADALYREIRYPRVWQGIDARVSPAHDGLRYSFDVSSGADPRTIHLHYSGVVSIELSDAGSLTVEAEGERFTVTRPVAFQNLNGRRIEVPVRFVPFASDVAFSVGRYDRTLPLTIESVTKS